MKTIPFTIREFKSITANSRLFSDAMAYHFMEMKEIEKKDFTLFADLVLRNLGDNEDIGGLYFDTDIKITPDFDCLFFSEEVIVNIDLKDIHNKETERKSINKFKVQGKILNLTNKVYSNLVFFANEEKLYRFNQKNNTLEEYSIAKFSKIMSSTHAISTNLIYSLKPSDYIISPTENIEGFLKGQYYLEAQQWKVEEIIMTKPGIYGVNGEAGTGKTLIAFDLAKKFRNLGKKVLFIFSGNLHEGHEALAERLDITIIPAKQMVNLNEYDLIIVDEAQKLYSTPRKWLYNWGEINSDKKTLVFFYHVKQTLSSKDSGQLIQNLCKTIEKDGMGKNLYLSKKIRSNPAITAFANNLFDLNHSPSPKKFSLDDFLNCIDIKYFSNAEVAKPWIRELVKKGYKFLVPAGDRVGEASSDKFRYDFEEFFDTHNIIGEEKNKIVTYIDECVAYNNKGKLRKNSKEYYFIDNEIYVNLTRAKEKLAIAIIGNFDIYEAITEVILNPEKWRKSSK